MSYQLKILAIKKSWLHTLSVKWKINNNTGTIKPAHTYAQNNTSYGVLPYPLCALFLWQSERKQKTLTTHMPQAPSFQFPFPSVKSCSQHKSSKGSTKLLMRCQDPKGQVKNICIVLYVTTTNTLNSSPTACCCSVNVRTGSCHRTWI